NMNKEKYKQVVSNKFELDPLREDARQNRYKLKLSSFDTLYISLKGDMFFLYPAADHSLIIEKNKVKMKQTFASFQEWENFLKRNEQAWIVKDDIFVDYLKDRIKKL